MAQADTHPGAIVPPFPPEPVTGPQAWSGRDLRGTDEWVHTITAAEAEEIVAAVRQVEARGRELLAIGQDDFPLPTLAARLHGIRREVLHGRGVFVLRGLPLDALGNRGAAVAFWGLGRYLGEPVSQNGKGHVLGHVKNLGLDYDDPDTRGYQTSAALPYHTDFSDIVALLCLRTAPSGGLSSVVSSTTLWNELVRRRPDLAAVLTQPVCRSRWGEVPAGRRRYAESSIFSVWEGRVICGYVRSAIRKAQCFAETPRLTTLQNEAMDLLDALAAEPDLHLTMELRPGDIQLLCNHSMLHARTAYTDHAEPERRRHLLRLWLACDDGPALPPHVTAEDQEGTASGRPNGINVPGVPFSAPLDAC